MTSNKGRKIHGQAEHAREGGDFLKSLQILDEALITYLKDKDYLGAAETQGSRMLAFDHLGKKTGDDMYLILAKHAALASVELAEKSGDKTALALPYERLGMAYENMGEIDEAVRAFAKAVENMKNNPPKEHDRKGVLANMKMRLATVEYKNGDKSALARAEKAIQEIIDNEEVEYTRDVWSSGGHMRIAEMLRRDNPEKARKHLESAKKIIDANPDLKLRAKQWEKLSESFK